MAETRTIKIVGSSIADRIVPRLETINPWHFLWITILLAEVVTLVASSLNSLILYGGINFTLLETGMVYAFVISLLVAPVPIYFVGKISGLRATNKELGEAISEKESMEAELKKFQNRLEDLVRKRTAELNQAHEHLKEEMAERKKADEETLAKTFELNETNEELRSTQEALEILNRDLEVKVEERTADLVEMNERLMFEMEKLQSLYDNHPDAVTVIDSDYLVSYGNKHVEEIVGVPLRKILGRKCYEALMGYTTVCTGCEIQSVLEDKKPRTKIKFDKTASGKEVLFWHLWYPVLDMEGEVESVVEIARDITDIRQTQEDLENAYSDLEKAYNELKTLDELKDNIISNVSHELRTPITVIRGILELISGASQESRDELIEVSVRALERQDSMISDILEAVKMNRGDEVPEMRQLDIRGIILEVVDEFVPESFRKDIHLEHDLRGPLPKVLGNYDKLRHLFRNLLRNALKFTPKGGRINVMARAQGGAVEVRVEDSGVGIPGDKMDKVFDRFYQVDPSPTRKFGGSGMGLSVVKEITESHGGTIRVESEEGKGSTFIIDLPAVEVRKEAE